MEVAYSSLRPGATVTTEMNQFVFSLCPKTLFVHPQASNFRTAHCAVHSHPNELAMCSIRRTNL